MHSGLPWLIEGPRGGGKIALAEAVAQGCNLPLFYLQGMEGLTLADVLYDWDREAQTQWMRQALASGLGFTLVDALILLVLLKDRDLLLTVGLDTPRL